MYAYTLSSYEMAEDAKKMACWGALAWQGQLAELPEAPEGFVYAPVFESEHTEEGKRGITYTVKASLEKIKDINEHNEKEIGEKRWVLHENGTIAHMDDPEYSTTSAELRFRTVEEAEGWRHKHGKPQA